MTLPLPVADIVEIQQTLARYGHVVDNGDADALGQIFADAGVIFPPTRGHAPLRGLASRSERWRERSLPCPPALWLSPV
ncbi:MAG: hypothetical protein QOK24_2847 [Verrucomicrobiota bacterium]